MIVVLDRDPVFCSVFEEELAAINLCLRKRNMPTVAVTVYNGTISSFVDSGTDQVPPRSKITVCSPGNSFGFMNGGFDYFLTVALGKGSFIDRDVVAKTLKNHILQESNSYLPAGMTLSIDLKKVVNVTHLGSSNSTKRLPVSRLITCPTMVVPSNLHGSVAIIFDCVWNILHTFTRENGGSHKIPGRGAVPRTLIIPGLGTGTGSADQRKAVKLMLAAIFLFTAPDMHPLQRSLLIMIFLNKDYRKFDNVADISELEAHLTEQGKAWNEDGGFESDTDWKTVFNCINWQS